jgi:ribonuclease P/MRP protein subunit POP5
VKPRPPTLRVKRRYILCSIHPSYREYDPKQVHYAMVDAVTSLWGDARASEIQMSVVMCERGHVVVRCGRGTERDLETAVSTVTSINGQHVALRPVATSGTLRSLKNRMGKEPLACREREYEVGGIACTGILLPGQKVDLVEKGNKNQKILYFTQQELEES